MKFKPLWVVLLLPLLAGCLGRAAETPSAVVAKFCALDFAGQRLSSQGFLRIAPLVSYPAETGWDTAIGITGYRIVGASESGAHAEVRVAYDIDRSWPARIENLLPYATTTFRLTLTGGRWRISQPIMYPRVSAGLLCRQYGYCSR